MTINVNMPTLGKLHNVIVSLGSGVFTKGDGWREVLDLGKPWAVSQFNQDKFGGPSPGLLV